MFSSWNTSLRKEVQYCPAIFGVWGQPTQGISVIVEARRARDRTSKGGFGLIEEVSGPRDMIRDGDFSRSVGGPVIRVIRQVGRSIGVYILDAFGIVFICVALAGACMWLLTGRPSEGMFSSGSGAAFF
jgi:hypothetical protein